MSGAGLRAHSPPWALRGIDTAGTGARQGVSCAHTYPQALPRLDGILAFTESRPLSLRRHRTDRLARRPPELGGSSLAGRVLDGSAETCGFSCRTAGSGRAPTLNHPRQTVPSSTTRQWMREQKREMKADEPCQLPQTVHRVIHREQPLESAVDHCERRVRSAPVFHVEHRDVLPTQAHSERPPRHRWPPGPGRMPPSERTPSRTPRESRGGAVVAAPRVQPAWCRPTEAYPTRRTSGPHHGFT